MLELVERIDSLKCIHIWANIFKTLFLFPPIIPALRNSFLLSIIVLLIN